jgi:hypothetical protein
MSGSWIQTGWIPSSWRSLRPERGGVFWLKASTTEGRLAVPRLELYRDICLRAEEKHWKPQSVYLTGSNNSSVKLATLLGNAPTGLLGIGHLQRAVADFRQLLVGTRFRTIWQEVSAGFGSELWCDRRRIGGSQSVMTRRTSSWRRPLPLTDCPPLLTQTGPSCTPCLELAFSLLGWSLPSSSVVYQRSPQDIELFQPTAEPVPETALVSVFGCVSRSYQIAPRCSLRCCPAVSVQVYWGKSPDNWTDRMICGMWLWHLCRLRTQSAWRGERVWVSLLY